MDSSWFKYTIICTYSYRRKEKQINYLLFICKYDLYSIFIFMFLNTETDAVYMYFKNDFRQNVVRRQ